MEYTRISIFKNKNDPDNLNYTIGGYLFAANLVTHVFMLFILLFLGMKYAAVYNIVPLALFPLCIILNHNGKSRLAIILTLLEVGIFAIIATYTGGWSLGFYMYMLSVVAIGFYTGTFRMWAKIMISVFVTVILAYLYIAAPTLAINQSQMVVNVVFCYNLASSIAGVGIIYWYFDSQRIGFEKESAKSKELISNIEAILGKNISLSEEIQNIGESFSKNFESNIASQNEIMTAAKSVATSSEENVDISAKVSENIYSFSKMIDRLRDTITQLDENSAQAGKAKRVDR